MATRRTRLEARLRAVRRRLVLRKAARVGLIGFAGGAIAVALATVLLVLLPRLVMGASLGVPYVLASGVVGLIGAVVLELRGFRVPSLVDAALTMEARLPDDSGALAAVLKIPGDSAFAPLVLARAESDLEQAGHNPAPALVTTRRLVWIPGVCLLGAVALVYVFTLQPSEDSTGEARDVPRTANAWTEVDVGGGRGDEDRRAYRDALGLREVETSLRESAATLKDAAGSETAHQKALNDARAALEQGEEAGYTTGETLPENVPADAEARIELASRIESAASRAGALAESKLESANATRDTGREGEFETSEVRAELVPFPVPETSQLRDVPAEFIALQSPARRALAERAIKAYENLQQP